jgi:hypothetical protein
MNPSTDHSKSQSDSNIRAPAVTAIDFATAYQVLIASYLQLLCQADRQQLPQKRDHGHDEKALPGSPVATIKLN